jgi:hypothetical protein
MTHLLKFFTSLYEASPLVSIDFQNKYVQPPLSQSSGEEIVVHGLKKYFFQTGSTGSNAPNAPYPPQAHHLKLDKRFGVIETGYAHSA